MIESETAPGEEAGRDPDLGASPTEASPAEREDGTELEGEELQVIELDEDETALGQVRRASFRLMPGVTDSIEIAVAPTEVWAVIMDADRLGEWVTAHRSVDDAPSGVLSEGDEFKQKLQVTGPSFRVKWKVVEADDPRLAVWKGKGPLGSAADVRYELSETDDDGTHFDYTNNFELPGGPLARAAGGIAGAPAKKHARESLEKLKALLEG